MEQKTYINREIPIPWETVKHYEERYALEEKHEQMLDILCAFDAFCRENDIRYSLADGTLLGAMRHADFLPWDDDADVMLTREEYAKLRRALREDSDVKVFKICFLDRVTTASYREQKIYLDLFINEDMPASKAVFGWKKFKTRFLRTHFAHANVVNARHANRAWWKKALHRVTAAVGGTLIKLVVGKRDIFELNDRAVAIGKHRPSGIYTRFTSRMYETGRRFNKESYEAGYGDILFRGKTLMAIQNADTFLREMYGNYLSMPPEEKCVPEHALNMMNSPEQCLKYYN